MKFIISLVLIFIAFRLISSVVIRILAHKLNKSGMTGMHSDENAEEATSKNKKKIIPKDEGDYVDFEEIDKKDN